MKSWKNGYLLVRHDKTWKKDAQAGTALGFLWEDLGRGRSDRLETKHAGGGLLVEDDPEVHLSW
jgi:hypothetical protein